MNRTCRNILVIASLALAACQPTSSDDNGDVASLKAAVESLQDRLHKTEAYIEIANLQRAYGYYTDKALWDQTADLFSRDATLEISGRGVFVGNDHIRRYFKALPGLEHGTVFLHFQLQPVITIADDGKFAKGRWRATAQIGKLGTDSRIGEGIYENEYVYEDGMWKISKLHYYTNYLVNYDDAWSKPGEPILGPFENLPPDQPPTGDYKAYPEVSIPPFHYANPVTGRTE